MAKKSANHFATLTRQFALNHTTQKILFSYLSVLSLLFLFALAYQAATSSIVPIPSGSVISALADDSSFSPIIVPVKTNPYPPPELTAKSALIIDSGSSTILYQKNPYLKLYPASTTKIMTAIIALENYSLDDVITITEEERTIGQTMKLVRGERISVEDLLYGALVASGNDAALALALAYPSGGYSGFIQAMNQKAQQLHLNDTHFSNVSGVEASDHYSSAYDLAQLTLYALNHPIFNTIVQTQSKVVTSQDGQFVHYLYTTNQLLGKLDGVTGVKTGWTENAGECLVTSTIRNGHQLITVILNSQDRFLESARLIDWAYTNHAWKSLEQLQTENQPST